MAFTVQDFSDLIRLLEEHPEWRAQLRNLILPEEVLLLPDQLRQLVQAVTDLTQTVSESSQRFEQLLANQQQRLSRLEELVAQQSARLDRHEERLARLEELIAQQGERLSRLEELVAQQGERLSRLEELVAQQGERLSRLEELVAQQGERLSRLEERVDTLEQRLAELVETVRNLVEIVTSLVRRVDRLEQRQAKLSGFYYETHYRERAASYFGRVLGRARGLYPYQIAEMVEQHLSLDEIEEFHRTDVIVRGVWREDNNPVFLAMEVSETIDANDVVRAIRRAELLRKAGLRAAPAVAGESANEEARNLAAMEGVLVVTDGKMENLALVQRHLSAAE